MGKKLTKIIVLGAGASVGSKRLSAKSAFAKLATTRMPSAENFFYDLFEVKKTRNNPSNFLNFLMATNEGLNEVITRAWNINGKAFYSEEWKGVNIEDVMTFFEVSELMTPEQSSIYKDAQEALLDFMYPIIPLKHEGEHCEYLLKIINTFDKKDTIISYNWDSIADQTLAVANAIQFKNYAKLLRSKSPCVEEFSNKGLLLKLHGSFNWFLCQNKKCDFYNKIRPPFPNNRYRLLILHELWKGCPSCEKTYKKPYIVPPVSNKMIHKNSFLKTQWLIAREKLLSARELIFIGYSFPTTDFYTDWLFRQLNYINDRQEIKITVVNPEYGKSNSSVTKKYNSIFKGYKIDSYKTLRSYSESL